MSTVLPPKVDAFTTPGGNAPPRPNAIPEREIPGREVRPWHRVTIYKLQLLGAPVLKLKCAPFDSSDAIALEGLVAAMTAIVHRFGAWGLSAPQVGAAVRVVVAKLDGTLDSPLTTMINPEILTRSFDAALMIEGCLSVPSFETRVMRHKRIAVSYLDERWTPQVAHLAGMAAQVLQHECAHLDGWMLTDGVSPKRREQAEALVAKAKERLGL